MIPQVLAVTPWPWSPKNYHNAYRDKDHDFSPEKIEVPEAQQPQTRALSHDQLGWDVSPRWLTDRHASILISRVVPFASYYPDQPALLPAVADFACWFVANGSYAAGSVRYATGIPDVAAGISDARMGSIDVCYAAPKCQGTGKL